MWQGMCILSQRRGEAEDSQRLFGLGTGWGGNGGRVVASKLGDGFVYKVRGVLEWRGRDGISRVWVMEVLVGLGAVVLVGLIVLAGTYNGFVSRRNAMRNAFASIDVQLKKRWELIPNLVETVKGYAKQEREVFERVIEARNAARRLPAESGERFAKEEQVAEGAGRLVALAESYPELKSSGHFLNLQRNLTEIESQISASRRAYNAAVTEWNNGVENFPGNVFASMWNFRRADWFEVKTEERSRVDVGL